MEKTDARRRSQPQGQPRRQSSQTDRRQAQPSRRQNPNHQPSRRPEPPRRRESEEYRARQEEERRGCQLQSQRRIVSVLLVILASMLAVFCLYRPDVSENQVPHAQIEAHTDPTVPTEPPTEPPTEAPTEPATEPPTEPQATEPNKTLRDLVAAQIPKYVSTQIIDVDSNSRSAEKLNDITQIIIHYVGNPGATGQQVRDGYADDDSDISAHFVVGLEGEVIQCLPLDERASASDDRNGDTISIEVCHPDESGQFTDATYKSVAELVAWLVKTCGLKVDHVVRHYEVTGKECPLYYVQHEDAWWQLRADIAARVAK